MIKQVCDLKKGDLVKINDKIEEVLYLKINSMDTRITNILTESEIYEAYSFGYISVLN